MRSLALRRMLAVKVLAAGALTVGLGGVAMAATGMPLVPGGDHRGATAAGHASSTGSPTDRPSASGSPQDHGSPSRTGTPGAVRPGRDVRAALLVACRTWLADHPKASPAPTQNASGRHVEGAEFGLVRTCARIIEGNLGHGEPHFIELGHDRD